MKTIFKTEKIELLTSSEIIKGLAPLELVNLFGETQKERRSAMQDEFGGLADCDYIKTGYCGGRGQEMFSTYNIGETTYIISPRKLTSCAKRTLKKWLFGEPSKEIAETWKFWQNVSQGIAYRGGAGYTYALNAYKL